MANLSFEELLNLMEDDNIIMELSGDLSIDSDSIKYYFDSFGNNNINSIKDLEELYENEKEIIQDWLIQIKEIKNFEITSPEIDDNYLIFYIV